MAGGNHHSRPSPHHKPSSSSSNHRKTRWESGGSASNPPLDRKPLSSNSGDPKLAPLPPPKPSPNPKLQNKDKNPTPPTPQKPNPTPSPARPKFPHDPSGSARFPNHLPAVPLPSSDQPTYGFHMLVRRTIVLADGQPRTYFALPPDYEDFTPPMEPPGRFFPGGIRPEFGGLRSPGRIRHDPYGRNWNQDYRNSFGGEGSLKRKFGEDEREVKEDYSREKQQLLQYGNANSSSNMYSLSGTSNRGQVLGATSSSHFPREDNFRASSKYMRIGGAGGYEGSLSSHSRQSGGGGDRVGLKHGTVNQDALKKAFMRFAKLVNENPAKRKKYLEDGRDGNLQCVVCGRSSKDFPDMHSLIMHTYHSDSAELLVDHLGFHKALCVLMGWNYAKPPDSTKLYQLLSANDAAAIQDDLIMWPPLVIIHNTSTGKGKEGRVEGLGNKAMDMKIRDLGFRGGKSKSLYNRDGHLGITLIKFAGDQSGLKEAMQLSEHFEKENHGRRSWARLESITNGKDDENNPYLVKVHEKTGEKLRILYGYLGTAADQDKVDVDMRKKVMIESIKDLMQSK